MESLDEVIISEIRDNYPFLYNVRDRKYRLREEREKAWAEIGSIVDLDVKTCKTRWRSLRDRYLKERRKSSDSPERKKWRLVPMLEFLDDTLEAKMPRMPSVLRKRSPPSDPPIATTRRIILPAVALSSSSSARPSPAAAYPVSILKAEGTASPSSPSPEGRRQLQHLQPKQQPLPPPPPAPVVAATLQPSVATTLQPSVATTLQPSVAATLQPSIAASTSLLLLPPQTTITSSPAIFDATTATTSYAHCGDSQRKEMDQLGKMPLNPPQALDEEDYYGLSVAGRLKKLSQRDRALVRIEIEKLFLDYET